MDNLSLINIGLICPYCMGDTEYVDSSVIYGKSYGMIYLCKPCDAYCGVHRGTNKSLGRLANKELRYWKKEAHKYFDVIWKSKTKKRNDAYAWLSEKMNLPIDLTHIGMMDIEQCQQVIQICKNQQQ